MVPEMSNTNAGGFISGIADSTTGKKFRLHLITNTVLSIVTNIPYRRLLSNNESIKFRDSTS